MMDDAIGADDGGDGTWRERWRAFSWSAERELAYVRFPRIFSRFHNRNEIAQI